MSGLTAKIHENMATRGEAIVLQYNSVGKGLKWTLKDVWKYTYSLASGLQELGFGRGDSIACRLKPDRPEKHCALFAAATLGARLVSIDVGNEDAAATRQILKEHACKLILYNEPDVMHLEAAVPEFKEYTNLRAHPFMASGLPRLKYFVTVALPMHKGSMNYPYIASSMDANLEPAETADDELLYVEYDAAGKRTDFTHGALVDAASSFPELEAVLAPSPHIFQ